MEGSGGPSPRDSRVRSHPPSPGRLPTWPLPTAEPFRCAESDEHEYAGLTRRRRCSCTSQQPASNIVALVPGVVSVCGKCPPPNPAGPLSQLGCSLTPCSMPVARVRGTAFAWTKRLRSGGSRSVPEENGDACGCPGWRSAAFPSAPERLLSGRWCGYGSGRLCGPRTPDRC